VPSAGSNLDQSARRRPAPTFCGRGGIVDDCGSRAVSVLPASMLKRGVVETATIHGLGKPWAAISTGMPAPELKRQVTVSFALSSSAAGLSGLRRPARSEALGGRRAGPRTFSGTIQASLAVCLPEAPACSSQLRRFDGDGLSCPAPAPSAVDGLAVTRPDADLLGHGRGKPGRPCGCSPASRCSSVPAA